MKKTIKSILLYFWRYVLLPVLAVFAFTVLSVIIGVKYPEAVVVFWFVLIAVMLTYALVALKKKWYFVATFFFVLALFLSWMRRWETYLLHVKTTQLPLWFQGRFVVLSDVHIWPYKWKKYMQQLVDKINAQTGVDAVFVVWDWVYEPRSNTLQEILSPLEQVKYPVYTVLWNHDEMTSYDGENIKPELLSVLDNLGIVLLENEELLISTNSWQDTVRLFWLWDERVRNADVTVLSGIQQDDNVIVLAHNPDTIMRYGQSEPLEEWVGYERDFFKKIVPDPILIQDVPVDITFAGHTHASQLRFFGLTDALTPTKYVRKGDWWNPQLRLFISTGVGETIAPVRLGNRVRIDLIESY